MPSLSPVEFIVRPAFTVDSALYSSPSLTQQLKLYFVLFLTLFLISCASEFQFSFLSYTFTQPPISSCPPSGTYSSFAASFDVVANHPSVFPSNEGLDKILPLPEGTVPPGSSATSFLSAAFTVPAIPGTVKFPLVTTIALHKTIQSGFFNNFFHFTI